MNLKNYTSTVPVSRSISLIEDKLINIGAKTISKFYDNDMNIEGFIFQIVKQGIPSLIFKLPSKWKQVEKVMRQQIKKPRSHTFDKVSEQAQRTAWKILYDWICIQVSLIELEQAEIVEVFLPYVYDEKKGKTFFEIVKENNMKLLNS